MYSKEGFATLPNLIHRVLHSLLSSLDLILGSEAFNVTPFLASECCLQVYYHLISSFWLAIIQTMQPHDVPHCCHIPSIRLVHTITVPGMVLGITNKNHRNSSDPTFMFFPIDTVPASPHILRCLA